MAREFGSRDADCMALLKNLSPDQILELLSQGLLCDHCDEALKSRALRFVAKRKLGDISISVDDKIWSREDYGTIWRSDKISESYCSRRRDDKFDSNLSNMERLSSKYTNPEISLNRGLNWRFPQINDYYDELSEELQELTRFEQVGRKKEFFHLEEIDGEPGNVLQGLELYTEVFNSIEQRKIVDYIFMLQRKGELVHTWNQRNGCEEKDESRFNSVAAITMQWIKMVIHPV